MGFRMQTNTCLSNNELILSLQTVCIGEVFRETEGQFFFSRYLFWVCNPRSLKIFFFNPSCIS